MQQEESLSDDFDENYDRFIDEAIATGCVWGLESDEGWALCPSVSNEEISVMPLWSQPEFAQQHCRDEWSGYRVIPISLEELLDDWLPGMHEDVLLIGVNWNSDLEGEEIEPLDLLEDIDRVASEED
ncbi:hypothetical protein TDB9533_02576 [Thalassocella blandensis]|nr:hypothetical protein TDB9533_02576 [Thalassocella blandensis]